MLKNPWPSYWEPPKSGTIRHMKDPFCRYTKRYTLPCEQSRALCTYCRQRQEDISEYNMKYFLKDVDPQDLVHVCDRCGREVVSTDSLMYVTLQNRRGGTIIPDAELCMSCGMELAEWLKGSDFFLQDGGVTPEADALWGPDDE